MHKHRQILLENEEFAFLGNEVFDVVFTKRNWERRVYLAFCKSRGLEMRNSLVVLQKQELGTKN